MNSDAHALPPAREAEIQHALADWKGMVAPFQRANRKLAWLQVANTVGPLLLVLVAMYFAYDVAWWLVLLLGIPASFLLTRTFIIQHDCGHYSFFKSRDQCDRLGWLLSFLTTVPYTYWSRVHAFHHGHVGQLEHRDIGDINFLTVEEYAQRGWWGRLRYRLFRSVPIITLAAPLVYIVVMCRIPKVRYPGWQPVHRRLHLNNLALVGAYLVLGYAFGWARVAVVHGTVVLGFATIAFWFFYVQHQHEETYMRWQTAGEWNYLLAAIRGATFYDLPRVLHWLTGNIGYHHLHHLSSRIPNYHLARCAEAHPVLQRYVTTVGFWASLPMLRHKLWDERAGRMVGFGGGALSKSS